MFRSGGRWGFVLRGRERGRVVHRYCCCRWRWRCWMTTLLTRVVCVLMGDEVVMMQLLDVAVALSLFNVVSQSKPSRQQPEKKIRRHRNGE